VLRHALLRRDRHRRDRWRRDVRERSGPDARVRIRREVRRSRGRVRLRPAPRDGLDGKSPRAHSSRSAAHLQSRLLHVGRAAGRASGGLRRAREPVLLARPARSRPDVGRDDRRGECRSGPDDGMSAATSMVCSGCGYVAPPLERRPFRRPHAGSDEADHVLRRQLVPHPGLREAFFDDEPDPFIRYRRLMHSWNTAQLSGIRDADYIACIRRLEERIVEIDQTSFHVTPLLHEGALWIKDDTGNVSGSHKGRHLMGLMIWLELFDRDDRALAIASCGNAALAAAVVARAARRRLEVFVPADASAAVVERLEELGAHVTRCARRQGETGDPSYLRFREAIAAGALPFTCQGNENGLVIEGGQTLGGEMVSQLSSSGATLDRLFIQTGGGALASACIAAFENALALRLIDRLPRIHAVQ